ncbi:MAG: SDR family NAD(P)-dependent oxidoreductase [Chitinophagales bacterium]
MEYFKKSAPNKTAFITGAASGLGRALTLELAAQNWTIGICDLNTNGLKETQELAEQSGGKIQSYSLNITDSTRFQEICSDFLAKTNSIDVLINNAGIGASGKTDELSIEYWNKVIGINQMAVVFGCKFFIPQMKKQGSGTIINIASAAAFSSAAGMGPYNVSKAAVLSLSETLHAELKDENISVSVVMPTFFKTNIMQDVSTDSEGRRLGELMIATSGLEPDAVARTILKAASKKQFYIILPWKSKMLYIAKRWMPGLMLKINAMLYRKREKLEKMLEKKYQKQQAEK